MALKFRIEKREEIPAGQEALYVERDGAWVLNVEGDPYRAKLDEFRSNNKALLDRIDALQKRFEGIDPEEARTAAEEKRKLEEQVALKAGEFEKVLAARLEGVRRELGAKVTELGTERDGLLARLATIQIDQALVSAATKRGLRPTAIPDITARARSVFRLVGGVPTAVEADGKTVRVGRDGVSPLTLDEWVEVQGTEAPHLFEQNAGGGASGDGGGAAGGAGSRKNPFKKGADWNLTEQMRLLKQEPVLAARLQAAA